MRSESKKNVALFRYKYWPWHAPQNVEITDRIKHKKIRHIYLETPEEEKKTDKIHCLRSKNIEKIIRETTDNISR